MPLRLGTPMPDLTGATEWLNGTPQPAELTGHLVLVHFWAVSCRICHENMPQISAWRDEYAPQGLRVIAIHLPRQADDTAVDHVRQDAAVMHITEPCGIDNQHAVADAFLNEYVPAYFLFTRNGALCGRAAGYHGLKMIEAPLKRELVNGACDMPTNQQF